jgi:RNA polymerase sigma-70 factor (ECF subfamily)
LKEVFEENYEWFKRLLRVKFIHLNDYDIEDLIQQAALKLLYKDNLAGIKNLASYVYTMLENGAKDHFRKRNRETLTSEDAGVKKESTEESVLKGELKLMIMRSIDRLEENQRYVFVETEIKGRSYNELIRETGEKLGTLLSRKSRAVKKLKEMIREYLDEEDV